MPSSTPIYRAARERLRLRFRVVLLAQDLVDPRPPSHVRRFVRAFLRGRP